MRTTLTLDDDVAAALERLRKSGDLGLKELVNNALRAGLRQIDAPPVPRARFQTQSVSLGACRLGQLDNIADALAFAEGESFR